jgi:hypothetical protein
MSTLPTELFPSQGVCKRVEHIWRGMNVSKTSVRTRFECGVRHGVGLRDACVKVDVDDKDLNS